MAGLIATTAIFIMGCGTSSDSVNGNDEKKEIKVGVTAGPQAEMMDEVAKEATKQGLTIKVIEFNDFIQPNKALAEKDLDMNVYQHKPYLDNVVQKQGLPLTAIGKTAVLPMAMYSNKYKSLAAIPTNAKVTIPNDPSNGARALLLLQKAGLITLKTGEAIEASVADVAENPKNLQIIELDAAQITRSLDDTDFACINTNYALSAGLNPQKDSLFVEDKESPYACVIVVRDEDKDDPTYKKVVSIYQSEPIRKFIEEKYQGAAIPAF